MIENLHGETPRSDPGDSAPGVPTARSMKRTAKGHVILDRTWARLLGVRRSGGMYRIARRELAERLAQLQRAPATDAHQDSFDRALVAAGIELIELAEARRRGRFVALDGDEQAVQLQDSVALRGKK